MKKIYLIALLFPVFVLAQEGEYRTGLEFDNDAYNDVQLKARNVSFQDVITEITKVSLREFVPDVRNQGGYGTCVGWSSAYYGRTILNARINNVTDKYDITKNAFAPIFTYLNANTESDYNCQQGALLNKAMQHMVDKGSPFLRDFNSLCANLIPDSIYEKALDNKIKDFTRLFRMSESPRVKIEAVKRSLVDKNPVIVGFKVDNSFSSAKTVYVPDTLGITGGHAMCVIGYDDDKYGGAFEVINSWGANWGNQGFMWIRYRDFAERTSYAYEMIPFPKRKTIEKNNLAGSMELRLNYGYEMEVEKSNGKYKQSVLGFQTVEVDSSSQSIGDYVTKEKFPINTRYKILTKVNKPSYVYVLGVDNKRPVNVLFPENDSISAYINSEKAAVQIPPKGKIFRLDTDDVPSDYTITIFSLEKLDIYKIKEQMDNMTGDVLDKLYVVFDDKLINRKDIKIDANGMSFNAEFEKGTIATLILDIKRDFKENISNEKR